MTNFGLTIIFILFGLNIVFVFIIFFLKYIIDNKSEEIKALENGNKEKQWKN
jgi:hypothetical protein